MPKRRPTLQDLRNGIGRAMPPPPLTQEQAAKLANLSQSMVAMIEAGRRNPSPRALWRLAQVYGVSYEAIVEAAEETARRGVKA
jgi:transcriptional regulator with XRE-family HTH domain